MLVRERKMSEIEQKWSPGVSLEQADAFIKNLASISCIFLPTVP